MVFNKEGIIQIIARCSKDRDEIWGLSNYGRAYLLMDGDWILRAIELEGDKK